MFHPSTPLQDVEKHYTLMSLGGWKQELLDLLKAGCNDTQVFRKIYFQDGTLTDENLGRHVKCLFTLVSKRAKSILGTYMKPPWRYSALTDCDLWKGVLQTMVKEWKLILAAEAASASGQECILLPPMHFLQSSFCRLQFLSGEQDALVPGLTHANSDAVLLAKIASNHLGDTIVIENTHQKCKDLLSQARHETSSRLAKFQAVVTSNVFAGRNLEHLKVSELAKAKASTSRAKSRSVIKTTHPSNHAMSKKYQSVMAYKASRPNFTWPSTSQSSLFDEVACLELLVHLGANIGPDTLGPATVTCLVGQAGDLVANKQSSRLVMVVAVGQLAFLGLEAQVISHTDEGQLQMALVATPSALQWHFMMNLDDWLAVPAKPVALHRYGPLIFQQTGEPCQLLAARIEAGLFLTIKQCQAVLKHYNVKFDSQMKKRDYFLAIFGIFLTTEEEKEKALERSGLNKADDDEEENEGTDYEDILEQVEEMNAGDPGLKAEKAKLKQRKQKQNLDTISFNLPRGRGRGRGKGRGKGGRKGRGRGRGRSSLSEIQLGPEAEQEAAGEPVAAASDEAVGSHLPSDKLGEIPKPDAAAPDDAMGSPPLAEQLVGFPEPEVPAPAQAMGSHPSAADLVAAETVEREAEDAEVEKAGEEDETEKKKKRGTTMVKIYESPHHLLDPLAPPHSKLTLSCVDWRFTIRFTKEAAAAEWSLKEWKQKSYSRSFGSGENDWKDALVQVHTFGWRKWGFAKRETAFKVKAAEIQTPGEIPQETLTELEKCIAQLPERARNTRQRTKE